MYSLRANFPRTRCRTLEMLRYQQDFGRSASGTLPFNLARLSECDRTKASIQHDLCSRNRRMQYELQLIFAYTSISFKRRREGLLRDTVYHCANKYSSPLEPLLSRNSALAPITVRSPHNTSSSPSRQAGCWPGRYVLEQVDTVSPPSLHSRIDAREH